MAAVCDCFEPYCGRFVAAVGKDRNWKTYEDFRKMIESEKLDGVMVETTTHARAWIVIQAMQAGMDAYIEKPMCLTIAEGRTMVKAARKYNRVTQVGTQQRSMPINNWASDLVKNGRVGQSAHGDRPQLRQVPTSGPISRPSRCPRAAATIGGTFGRTRRCCGPTICTSTTAGTAGGTTTAAAAASALPAGAPTPTIRSIARWAPTTPAPSRSFWKSRSR